ncbi:interleukin-6 receptor subunit beta-like isoform X2 [Pomacea canaliculata]|uniref:interleukin-6 receptor subunit beta-like isoform X2 n=1 Tax=Pomacea canaliculata TaxID=400727 RepID=UPI000D72554C|nr:interleukin-6 receptor subunit beta-like isoform X2 [Pomacea canaliculata]
MRPREIPHHLSFVTACLLACCLPVIGQSSPNSYGVLRPDDPRPFVGDNLTLFCNLTKRDVVENSTRLFFRRDGELVPANYVDIINSRTIRLRYPIRQPQDEGLFTCILNRTHGEQQFIGSQRVLADYRPVKVENIDCIVNNWENMTCTWDLGRNFNHLDKVNVTLVWTISGEQRDCPIQTKTSCTWTRGPKGFRQGALYYMSVEVMSYLDPTQLVTASSSVVIINTSNIVKPAPVANLSSKARNATCLLLTWSHPSVYSKVAVVEYQSEWQWGVWNQVNVTEEDEKPEEVLLCGLTPFTEYTVRVAVWPRTPGKSMYQSDWQYKIERTGQAVPEVAPEMCVGCFTNLSCDVDDCRHVIVYWQPIPQPLRYSIVGSYHLRVLDGDQVVDIYNTTGADTSCFLRLSAARAYTVQLFAVTELGQLSLSHSAIRLNPLSDTPAPPRFFVVEVDSDTSAQGTSKLYLSWSRERDTANYSVFWCRGSKMKFKCDIEDYIHSQSLTSSSASYTLSLDSKGDEPDSFLVGLSRQAIGQDGSIASSGIQWSRCFYQRNMKPPRVRQVKVGTVRQEASLQVSWDLLECPYSSSYVNNYTIVYCNTTNHNHNICEGPSRNVTVEWGTSSYVLKDLNPGAYVRVEVAAGSWWGQGPLSSPVYFPVPAPQQAEEPTNFSIIGVVIGVIVLLVMILVCICKLRGKYRKGLEKFGTTRDSSPAPQTQKPSSDQSHPMKDRPLPKLPLPPVGATATETGTSTLAESSRGVGRRVRSGKHESITSETSLLGHEERSLEHDDGRRRHRSGASATSEKSKLLPGDSPARDTLLTSRGCPELGAEARYSGDHDYASVESGGGGSSSSSSSSSSSGSDSAQASGGSDVGVTDLQRYLKYPTIPGQHGCQPERPESGHSEDDDDDDDSSTSASSPFTRHDLERRNRAHERTRKLSYPTSLPPPRPPGYRQGARATPSEHLTLPRAQHATRVNEDRQPLMSTFGRLLKPMPAEALPGLTTTLGSDRTLPLGATEKQGDWLDADRTAHETNPGQIDYCRVDAPSAGHMGVTQSSALGLHALTGAAASSAAGTKAAWIAAKPAPAAKLPGKANTAGINGVVGTSAVGGADVGSGEGESIYSPPWDSKGLAPFVAAGDNRPLSEYMLQLPSHFFTDNSQRGQQGPTTEL